MAHHNTHGGYARAAQRRREQYAMCSTCGQRSHRFQAERYEQPETILDSLKAFAVLLLLVVAFYVTAFAVAAYGMGLR